MHSVHIEQRDFKRFLYKNDYIPGDFCINNNFIWNKSFLNIKILKKFAQMSSVLY